MSSAPKFSLKARIFRIFSWVTGISLGSLVLVVAVSLISLAVFVRTDTFQNGLRDRVVQAAKKELGANISFELAQVSLFRFEPQIEFQKVTFEHPETKTSVVVGKVKVGISLFVSLPLLFFRKLHLSSVEVDGFSYHLSSLQGVKVLADRLRPKHNYLPTQFQTSLQDISLTNCEVSLELSPREVYEEGLSGLVTAKEVHVSLSPDQTRFSGAVDFRDLKSKSWGPVSGRLALDEGVHHQGKTEFRGARLEKNQDKFEISGSVEHWEDPVVKITGKIEGAIENLVNPSTELRGQVTTDFSLQGSWKAPAGEGHALIKNLQWKKKSIPEASAHWKLEHPWLHLDSLIWRDGVEEGQLRGKIPLESEGSASIDLQLKNADLGSYLALAAPALQRWKGLAQSHLHYEGSLYPQMKGHFKNELALQDWQIRTSKNDAEIFSLPEMKLTTEGDLDGITKGHFSAELLSQQSQWTGKGRWSSADFLLEWNSSLKASQFGSLFNRPVRVNGAMPGSLKGPWAKLILRVEPHLSEFSLGQNHLTNLRGLLMLENRELIGAPVVADQLSATGGIRFVKDGSDEFANLRAEFRGIAPAFVFQWLKIPQEFSDKLGGRVNIQGGLRGPLTQPIGSGDLRVDDWTWQNDHTRGRTARAKWAMAGGELFLDNIDVRLSSDNESLQGEMSFDHRGLVDLTAEGKRLKTNTILYLLAREGYVQGLVDLSVDYQRNSPSLRARLALREASVAGIQRGDSDLSLDWVANRMDFSAKLFGNEVVVDGVSQQSGGRRDTKMEVKVDQFDLASVFKTLSTSRLEIPLRGRGSISYAQDHVGDADLLPGLFSQRGSFRGSLAVRQAQLLRSKVLIYSVDPFEFKLDTASQSGLPRWELPKTRVFSSQASLMVSGFFEERNRYELSTVGRIDLRVLAGLTKLLSRSEGSADVDGVWSNDGFVGSLQVADGLLTFQNSPLLLQNVQATLRGRGKNFELSNMKADFREGSLSSSGFFQIQDGLLQSGRLSVQLDNSLFQPQSGVAFRASGPLQLKITSASQGELSGKLRLKDGWYRRRFDVKADLFRFAKADKIEFTPLEEPEKASWQQWKLDLAIDTDEPFSVRNNLAEGEAQMHLALVGSLQDPLIKGSVGLVRGQFYFQNRQFTLRSGSIQFTDAASNIPTFDIRADTEVSDWRVFIQLLGSANDFKVNYSSDPALSQKDILSLVISGYKASDVTFTTEDYTRSAQVSGVTLVTGQLQDKIESGLSSGLGIRRFGLLPAFDETSRRTDMQLLVGTDLIRNKLEVNYSNFLYSRGHKVELDLKLTRILSLIGSWRSVEGQDTPDLGGDLRFRFEVE